MSGALRVQPALSVPAGGWHPLHLQGNGWIGDTHYLLQGVHGAAQLVKATRPTPRSTRRTVVYQVRHPSGVSEYTKRAEALRVIAALAEPAAHG